MILHLITAIPIVIGVNMKVLFKHMINGYTGKADDSIIYYNRYLNRVIIRRRPDRKNGEENRKFGSVNKNLKNLGISDGYKADFKIYNTLYSCLKENQEQSVFNWYFLFLKMMFALGKKYDLDLETISKADIYEKDLPCITIKRAVEDGLLPVVTGYERFTAEM